MIFRPAQASPPGSASQLVIGPPAGVAAKMPRRAAPLSAGSGLLLWTKIAAASGASGSGVLSPRPRAQTPAIQNATMAALKARNHLTWHGRLARALERGDGSAGKERCARARGRGARAT